LRATALKPIPRRMRARLVAVAVVVLLALVAAGCGGSESVSAVSGEPIALEELSRSAATSAEATSGRFAFDMRIEFPGADEPMSLSGDGAFDKPGQRAAFAVDMSAFAQLLGGFVGAFGGASNEDMPDFDDPEAWRIEVIQDGNVSYVRFPAVDGQLPEGRTWIRSDGKSVEVGGLEVGELQGLAGSDPRDLLELLESVGGEIELVGVEELRGVETTHYRAKLDPAEYAKTATSEERASLGPLAEPLQARVGEVPVDVWLDGDGMVRKLSFDISAEDGGQVGSASVSFELWDYGEDVDIDLPPADHVVDATAVGP
jgi:hypothetical protein